MGRPKICDQEGRLKPLTTPDCDLRDFAFMPLDVVRLRDSDISAISSGDEFRCAVLLWCASWHQIPAASIPDDDKVLAQLAGFGRVVKEWLKVRDGALRGWIKCDDGRLYHPVVAEKANEAWEGKHKYREKKEADRIRLAEKRAAEKLKNETHKPQSSSGDIARQNENVAATNKEVAKSRGDNGLIGTVDSGEGQWTVDSGELNTKTKAAHNSEIQDRAAADENQKPQTSSLTEVLQKHGVTLPESSPVLAAWIADGFTLQQMLEAIGVARIRKPYPEKIPIKYLDPILREASEKTAMGPPWWSTEELTCAKGTELGCLPNRGEAMPEYRNRLHKKIQELSRGVVNG